MPEIRGAPEWHSHGLPKCSRASAAQGLRVGDRRTSAPGKAWLRRGQTIFDGHCAASRLVPAFGVAFRLRVRSALGARQWDRAPRRRRLRRPRRARRPSPPPNQLRRPFQKSDQLRDLLPQRQIGSHIGPAVPARGALRVVPERALPAGDHDVLLVVAVESAGRGEREIVSSEPPASGNRRRDGHRAARERP